MTLSDSVILEFLDDRDLELPPKAIYRNLNRHGHEIGYSTVRLRTNELENNELLKKDDDGYYEISAKGKRWLEGDLDTSDFGDGE